MREVIAPMKIIKNSSILRLSQEARKLLAQRKWLYFLQQGKADKQVDRQFGCHSAANVNDAKWESAAFGRRSDGSTVWPTRWHSYVRLYTDFCKEWAGPVMLWPFPAGSGPETVGQAHPRCRPGFHRLESNSQVKTSFCLHVWATI